MSNKPKKPRLVDCELTFTDEIIEDSPHMVIRRILEVFLQPYMFEVVRDKTIGHTTVYFGRYNTTDEDIHG